MKAMLIAFVLMFALPAWSGNCLTNDRFEALTDAGGYHLDSNGLSDGRRVLQVWKSLTDFFIAIRLEDRTCVYMGATMSDKPA